MTVTSPMRAPCSIETIRGTYAWEMTGRTFDGGLSAETLPGGIPMLEGTVFPVHMTGVFTVGRDGRGDGRYAGLFGPVPLGYPTPLPVVASFRVHPDCTGDMTAPNGFGGINADKFVILDNGQEVRSVGMSGAPFAWQFTMVRIGRAGESAAVCGRNTVRGRYVMRCQGFEGAPTKPPSYTGVLPLFVFDVAADGTMAGRQVLAGPFAGRLGGERDGDGEPGLHLVDDRANGGVAGRDDSGDGRLLRQRQGGVRRTDTRALRGTTRARRVRRIRVPHDAAHALSLRCCP